MPEVNPHEIRAAAFVAMRAVTPGKILEDHGLVPLSDTTLLCALEILKINALREIADKLR